MHHGRCCPEKPAYDARSRAGDPTSTDGPDLPSSSGAGSSNDHENTSTTPGTGTTPTFHEAYLPTEDEIREWESFTVEQLKDILRSYRMPVSGIKRTLMIRLASRIPADTDIPPTEKQLKYIRHLEALIKEQAPASVFKSKAAASAWIDYAKDKNEKKAASSK